MSATDSYAVLAERLGFPGSQRLQTILAYLMTPEVARIAETLPGTPAEVAEKTGLDADHVRKELDILFFKGVAFPRGDYSRREFYRFARHIVQLHDASQTSSLIDKVRDRKLYELWDDFLKAEMRPWAAQMRLAQGRPGSRVVPAYKSIEGLSGVLPLDDYRELLKAQEHIAVVRCPCRYRRTAIDEHCEHTDEDERWNCVQFGRGADYAIARGAGKELTAEEAIDLAAKMEDDGLVHMWDNAAVMAGINSSCNCCRDCCVDYVSLETSGLPISTHWERSRFSAYVASSDACDGCQNCVDRCQFDAVEMVKVPGSKRLKAVVDEEKCYGCGLCVLKCDPGAMKMKLIRSVEHIPAAGVPAH